MVQAIKSGKKGLPRDFIPPPRLYQVSINVFIQGLSKIAAPHTPRLRSGSTRSSKSLSLAEDMADNNEVVGGDSQLFDELAK